MADQWPGSGTWAGSMSRGIAVAGLLLMVWGSMARAYEEAYPKTAAGFCEIKTLPTGVVLRTSGRGDYFQENNGLFMRLFGAIRDNHVPMTTPVEAGMKPGTMVFYLDPASAQRKDLRLPEGVTRQSLPERTVASVGVRGSYSRESYERSLVTLRGWLMRQEGWKASGEPYVVYWNSPFMIWFLKRSEVHIPVRASP